MEAFNPVWILNYARGGWWLELPDGSDKVPANGENLDTYIKILEATLTQAKEIRGDHASGKDPMHNALLQHAHKSGINQTILPMLFQMTKR